MLDLKKRLGALIPGDVRRARVADSFVLADVLSYRQLEVPSKTSSPSNGPVTRPYLSKCQPLLDHQNPMKSRC
jgi:hypothetical protein